MADTENNILVEVLSETIGAKFYRADMHKATNR